MTQKYWTDFVKRVAGFVKHATGFLTSSHVAHKRLSHISPFSVVHNLDPISGNQVHIICKKIHAVDALACMISGLMLISTHDTI